MTEESKKVKTISPHSFYFETPLYEIVSAEDLEEPIYTGEVDAYSVMYKSPTTYKISYTSMMPGFTSFDDFDKVVLTNKRKDDDKLFFFIFEQDGKYIKVGQLPTLAALQYTQIDEKYSKYIDKAELALLKKAIGLASHGVGAGSFVYLRKIFESQIKQAYEQHSGSLGISTEEFVKLRMVEKIDRLSEYLPSQLVQMKGIYGILSSGVHEMKESDCLKYFGPMKLTIELIMEQKVEDAIKKEKDKLVLEEIRQIQQDLKSEAKTV